MSSLVLRVAEPRAAYEHAEAGRMVEQHVEHPIAYEKNAGGVEPKPRGHHEQVVSAGV